MKLESRKEAPKILPVTAKITFFSDLMIFFSDITKRNRILHGIKLHRLFLIDINTFW